MGVFDKLKNALFEEEYVEVEEKPKKPKKEVFKKEIKREEKPIAKKVLLPKKEEKIEDLEEEELIDEDFEIVPKKEEVKKPEFKMMDDNDFKVEEEIKPIKKPEPEIVKVIDREVSRNAYKSEEPVYKKEEPIYYPSKNIEKKPYGMSEKPSVSIKEYGTFEKKEDKSHFEPSPIISPIYGILDKNYKKEDVVAKKEIHITSSFARDNLNVDDVRKKAYGSLKDDIENEIDHDTMHRKFDDYSFDTEDDAEDDSSLLVDLSDEGEKPAVKEVTMGDALEYFQDLGLEYNVDYVDASKDKDKATGRRVKDNYDEEAFSITEEEEKDEPVEEPIIKKIEDEEEDIVPKEEEKEETKEVSVDKDVDSDDNLFDLIDSMYKEEN